MTELVVIGGTSGIGREIARLAAAGRLGGDLGAGRRAGPGGRRRDRGRHPRIAVDLSIPADLGAQLAGIEAVDQPCSGDPLRPEHCRRLPDRRRRSASSCSSSSGTPR